MALMLLYNEKNEVLLIGTNSLEFMYDRMNTALSVWLRAAFNVTLNVRMSNESVIINILNVLLYNINSFSSLSAADVVSMFCV